MTVMSLLLLVGGVVVLVVVGIVGVMALFWLIDRSGKKKQDG